METFGEHEPLLQLALWRTFYGIEEQRRLSPLAQEDDEKKKGKRKRHTKDINGG